MDIKEKFSDELLELLNGTVVIKNHEVVYTLNECLEALNDEIIDIYYGIYRDIYADCEINDVSTLADKIIDGFRSGLGSFSDTTIEILQACKETMVCDNACLELVSAGFMFVFENDGDRKYVVPRELINLFKKKYTKKFVKDKLNDKIRTLLMGNFLISGVFPVDWFNNNIRQFYEFDYSDQEILDTAKSHKFNVKKINNREYYVMGDLNDASIDEDILGCKLEEGYRLLSYDEMVNYCQLFGEFWNKCGNILKDDRQRLFFITSVIMKPSFEGIKDDAGELGIPDKKVKKLQKLCDDYQEEFRFWCYNGKTLDEVLMDDVIVDYALKQKPNDDCLNSYIELLSKDAKEELTNSYDKNGSLDTVILSSFAEYIADYDKMMIVYLLSHDKRKFDYKMDVNLIMRGYVYLAYDDGVLKAFIPDEIKRVIAFHVGVMDDFSAESDIIFGYIDMNGVIKREKLQELLKEYHDLDYSIDELDKKVLALDFGIYGDYYTYDGDEYFVSGVEGMGLLMVKDKLTKYKVYADDVHDSLEMMMDEIDKCLNGAYDDDDTSEIKFEIYYVVRNNIYSEDILKNLLSDCNIRINKQLMEKIDGIVKKYKNDIPLWIYNGFTINEWSEINSCKKIGRNELCPCGSGKKYKHCCGK